MLQIFICTAAVLVVEEDRKRWPRTRKIYINKLGYLPVVDTQSETLYQIECAVMLSAKAVLFNK